MGHDVFISHAARDKAAADAVCAALETNGVRCWIAPRDILPGEPWPSAILRGIAACRMMVVVFSSSTNHSPHIPIEVERAVHRQIPIAPIRIEEAVPTGDLEYFLSRSHWMDALTPPLEQHLRTLAGKVRTLLEMDAARLAAVPNLASGTTPAPPAMPAPVDPRREATSPTAPQAVAPARIAPAPTTAPPHVDAFTESSHRPKPGRRIVVVSMLLAAFLLGAGLLAALGLRGGAGHQATVPGAYDRINTIGMKFVRIEPGTFQMGSPSTEEGRFDNESLHKVTLTRGFYMQTTPVTQAQWSAVMGTAPSNFKGDNLPVEQVSWDDANDFCRRISQKEGKKYRLPTEAEWEYACRAGTTTRFYTGDTEQALGEAGWYYGNSGNQTHPVATKAANKWGLYDMHGNVWQWCADYYGPYPEGDAVDPTGPTEGKARVVRGGSWNFFPQFCRCANRFYFAPGSRYSRIGFRIVLDFP